MPRFFFHFREGDQVQRDEEGIVVDSAQQAMAWAFKALDAMPHDETDGMLQVTDERGRSVVALPFAFSGWAPNVTRH